MLTPLYLLERSEFTAYTLEDTKQAGMRNASKM